MAARNYTLVIDLTTLTPELRSDMATTLIGAAKPHNIPTYWGTGAVLAQIDTGLAEHREFATQISAAGLKTHLR